MGACPSVGYSGFYVLNRPQFRRGVSRPVLLKNPPPLLAKRDGAPIKKLFWFGKWWPRAEELEIIQRFKPYTLVWPQCFCLKNLKPEELFNHLRQSSDQQTETYVLIREWKMLRYLAPIRPLLLERGLSFYFAAANHRGRVVSHYRYCVVEGHEVLYREWNEAELCGNVVNGNFRRSLALSM